MKFESHAQELILDPIERAYERASENTLEDARRVAGRHSRSGKFRDSLQLSEPVEVDGRLERRIGSPLSSAKAKEKGAYIRAKRGKYLVFDAGQGVRKVEAVRLAPQPAVAPAVTQFPVFMAARLVEELGR